MNLLPREYVDTPATAGISDGPSLRRVVIAAVLACAGQLLAGCASGPPVGGHAWVGISEIAKVSDLSGHELYSAKRNVDSQRLAAAGLTPADVDAGRFALVGCSPSVDTWWPSYAVLPPGLAAKPGQVVKIRVQEDTANDRLAINPVVGGIEPGLSSKLRAYELIPDWRERGLRNNYKKIKLPPELRGRYRIVQGSYGIAC
jgi:hypothetical protein